MIMTTAKTLSSLKTNDYAHLNKTLDQSTK